MHRLALLFFLLFITATSFSQIYSLRYIDTKTDASFRGLSVADEYAVWVSGSKGWIGRSVNGGKDWTFKQVPGYENCDFRSLYAFDAQNAIIANAGSPAYILCTSDGGANWKKVYENTDSAAFIDGVDFWNEEEGLIHGDPINGRMLLLYTKDGGITWKERKNSPKMGKGEASFAASGTSINCFMNNKVVIAQGGRTSKIFLSRNRGKSWRGIPTPMLAGSESTGIYSIILGHDAGNWLVAGGDYTRDTLKKDNFYYTLNKGKTWLTPSNTTRGYRECLAEVPDERIKKYWPKATIALGPTGIDISTDGGKNWKPLSDDKGFHVIKAGRGHDNMFLAGSNGKLAIMKTTP